MPKLTVDDLKKIKENATQEVALRGGKADIVIKVHMGTCGIAAGAREIMSTLLEERSDAKRTDIMVMAAPCTGNCENEPNITVAIQDQEPFLYGNLDIVRTRQVFKRHILQGAPQSDLIISA